MKIEFERIECSTVCKILADEICSKRSQHLDFQGLKFKTHEEMTNFIVERFFPSEPIKKYRLDKNVAIPKIYMKDLLKNAERDETCDLVVTTNINIDLEIILLLDRDTTYAASTELSCHLYYDACFDRLKLEQKLHKHKIKALQFLKKNGIDVQDVTFCIKAVDDNDTIQTIHPLVFWQNLSMNYGKALTDNELESIDLLSKSEDKENLQLLKTLILGYNWKDQRALLHKLFIKINFHLPIRRTNIHGVLDKFFSYFNKSKVFGQKVNRIIGSPKPGSEIPLLMTLCSQIPSPFVTRKEFDLLSFKAKEYLFDRAKENNIKIQLFPEAAEEYLVLSAKKSQTLLEEIYSSSLSPKQNELMYSWEFRDYYDLSSKTTIVFSQNDHYVSSYIW